MTPQITVLGIGNPIMGDDGVGLRILHLLQHDDDPLSWVPSHAEGDIEKTSAGEKITGQLQGSTTERSEVSYIDGGTSGMELLPTIQAADYLLVLDALGGPGESGSVVTLYGDQIPRLLNSKLSPHQVGLLDLLSAARLLGREPEHVAVVGVVAESCELGVGLSDRVAGALPEAVSAAQKVVDQWITLNEQS